MIVTIKKRILKPLLIVLTTLVLLVGIGIVVLMTEQGRLVKMGVEELNKNLKGEVTVKSSRLSLFKHFPAIGAVLEDVRLYPGKEKNTKPIFYAEKLFASVSLSDLLAGKHNVRRLSFHGGQIDLIQDENGKLNLLEALSTSADTTSSDSTATTFAIDLEKISIKDVGISYIDSLNSRRINSRIDDLSSSFAMDSSRMKIVLAGNLELDVTTANDTTFFRHKKVNLDISADYLEDKKILELTNGKFKLQDASFSITGTANLEYTPEVNLKVKGEEPDLHLLTAFIPGDIKAQLKPFRYEGDISFEGVVQGELSQAELPYIAVSFGCKNAWFLNEKSEKKVDELAFTGYYTNGYQRTLKSSELHIMNMNARPGEGIFRGNFVMRDFTDPHIVMQLQSELELGFLGHFFGIPDLQQFTGTVKLEMDFKELMDVRLPEQSLSKLKEGIQSQLRIENLSFHVAGYPHEVRNLNLQAEMKDGRITVDSASFRIGESDIRFAGNLSDIQGFLHDAQKTIRLGLNVSSDRVNLKELLSYDTALANLTNDEIRKFHIGLRMETTVKQLLHPSPLPNGKFEVTNLDASFKNYRHILKDVGVQVTISDTSLLVYNLNGMIDNSDFQFTGQVGNYHLWFNKIKSGKTRISVDFKSKRFAFDDIFEKGHRKFIPRGYRHEEFDDVLLRLKVELKYDTIFRFAKADISDVTGIMKNHKLQLKDIKGKARYGTRILGLDSLRGAIGKSDFEVNMRLYTGSNKAMKKKTNFFHVRSAVLDVDEIVSYDFSEPPRKKKAGDSLVKVVAKVDTAHAKAFNIFTLPFSDFNVWVDIDKLKYNKLWIRQLTGRIRLTDDHHLYVDTVGMKIAGGVLGIKGDLNGTDTAKLFLTCTMKVDHLDLEKVMIKLDHFGKDVVINKNIKGKVNGVINCKMQVHPNFVPIVGNTTAHLDINIYDGSLVDFSPMMAMASYFNDKNLRLIRFDSLKNKLLFENGVLTIPSMNINSSLGALEMSGKQSLDLQMEYYMRIPLRMVTKAAASSIFNKKTDAVDSTQVDAIQYVNGKGHFVNVKVTGTPSDYKVALGKRKGE